MIDENIQALLRESGGLELSTRAAAFLQQKNLEGNIANAVFGLVTQARKLIW